ncbi:MAG: hypothetical protein ACRC8S_06965 [Fimbriiglobus sp.]
MVTIQVIETVSVDPEISRRTSAQIREEQEKTLSEMELQELDRRRQKLDEELPPLRELRILPES